VLGAILTMGATVRASRSRRCSSSPTRPGWRCRLAAAVALPRLEPVMRGLRRLHRAVEIAAGIFIMTMGVLIFTNAFARTASRFSWFL
jgi:hypothetical protein